MPAAEDEQSVKHAVIKPQYHTAAHVPWVWVKSSLDIRPAVPRLWLSQPPNFHGEEASAPTLIPPYNLPGIGKTTELKSERKQDLR